MRLRFLGRSINSEDGNVFIAIFGAIAMVGILGASVMTFMKGPLATSVKLTKINTAENQMSIGAQVAVMATASQPNNGDCETAPDGYVEPIEWRAAGGSPAPTGGGLVPLSLGISKKDPWGTEYGYCVWNHGPTTSGAGCGANMLTGTNARIYPVVSIVSAGPDKVFTTTCRSFATADANSDGDLLDVGDFPLVSKAADTDDDVITSFTYDEATGVSGGLWSIKSGDPATAVIGKNIETTGTASLKGGLLLPDKALITCDASTAGVMAMNGSAIEICNGTTWDAITGGSVAGSGLVLSPNVSTGMDITAPCGTATCYSSNVVFTLTNNLVPAGPSVALAVNLSNTTFFEKVSDNCDGNIIPAAGTCQIVVRAKATGNLSYAGTLNVIGNNSPLATLDGTASGFGCVVGGTGPGGIIVACGVSGYNLITTPSGCSAGTSNPICGGGTDTVTMNNCTAATGWTTPSLVNGAQATVDLMAYSGGSVFFPPVEYCSNLSYGGFDDWYLPSASELQSYFHPARVAINLDNAASYGSSTYFADAAYDWPQRFMMSDGSVAERECGRFWSYRCARRDPASTFTPTPDTTPSTVSFTPSGSATAAEVRTSNSVTIQGVTSAVTVSVSGGTGAQFSKNGGAYTSTATTVTNGDTITLRATSPVAGQEDTISLSVGSASFSWLVRTVANNTIYAFVTSGTWQAGSIGGFAGADAQCNSEASSAGLGGSWIAYLGVSGGVGNGPAARLPWNWTTMKNMNNQVIATSVADFTDGTLSAAINRTASNTVPSASRVWVAAKTSNNSGKDGYEWSSSNCDGWTTTWSGYTGVGNPYSTSNMFYFTDQNCSASNAIYCIQDPGSALTDTDPNDVSIRPGISYVSGGAATSNTVTVTSILQPVTVSITPSAGTADIIVNGVAQGATSVPNVAPNATVQFSLTVPAVLGTKNTATITIGDDNYTWWAGYADSAKEAKAFVGTLLTYGNIGGLSGADARCTSLASSSPLGLSGSWVAMLSDSTQDMANRIPWNWGVLKTVNGATIVDGGYNDLLDGTLDGPNNWNQNGTAVNSTNVATGTNSSGLRSSGTSSGTYACNWTDGYNGSGCASAPYGHSNSTGGNWLFAGTTNSNSVAYLYCIEDVNVAIPDTTPNLIDARYPVQVPTSSRQTSDAVIIGGMSAGATTTLSVTATGGTPTFKVNGGAEVASASIQNGDSVVFLMDAPATGNTSNRMTITAGSMTSYWRVWTGDTTGTVVKRVFVHDYGWGSSTNRGGIAGLDAGCQSAATSAALGGTWKALASGEGNDETQFAVNRIGYNWTTLRRIDGVDVVLAGNMWSTDTTNLLAPIAISATGTTVSTTMVSTGSDIRGKAAIRTNIGQCSGYSNSFVDTSDRAIYRGTSGSTGTSWINNGGFDWSGYKCHDYVFGGMYCIEQ